MNPFQVEITEGNTRYIRRAFCDCPDGQARKEADETKRSYGGWKAQATELIKGLGVGQYANYRFGTWDKKRHGGRAYAWGSRVEKYAGNVRKDGGNWLYIHGPYGVGKTHLGVAATRQIAAERLWKPAVVVWSELCILTQESWDDPAVSTAGEWAGARAAGILLLDDLDKTSTKPWAMERLFALINYRYGYQKPTIITANHSLEYLKREWLGSDAGQAVLSRIAEMLFDVIECQGDDQRWQ